MNEAALTRLPAIALPLPRAWRALRWKQLHVALVGGFALLAFVVVLDGESQVFHGGDKGPNWPWIAIELVKYEIWTITLVLALLLADDYVDAGARRLVAYGLAIPIGCIVGVALSTWWFVLEAQIFEGGFDSARWPLILFGARFNLSTWLKLGGGLGFLYAEMRHSRQTRERLARAELDRTSKARLALESRLQAMQARVEPQFLFDTLADIRRLYASTPEHASRVLENLITYLRAAMPRMRDSASTVGQETDLARAYLEITAAARRDLHVEVDAEKSALRWRMPPMMLLPLIDYALACCSATLATKALHVSAACAEVTRLRVVVHAMAESLHVPRYDDRIATLQQRLQTLYGANAALHVAQPSAGELEVTLELPAEELAPDPA